MEKTSIVQIVLKPGEAIWKQEKRVNNKPNFRMIGVNKMNAIKLLTSLTPQEAYVFQEIMSHLDYITNLGYVSQKNKTSTQTQQFTTGYKRLKDKDMVVRLKRGQPSLYMVNPDLILPTNYDEALIRWNEATKKKKITHNSEELQVNER